MSDINKYISDFDKSSKDKNHRFNSWEHCYKHFSSIRSGNRNVEDFTLLHLAFFLASWGMYRGSTFLLWKDYKVLTSVVDIILKDKYDNLQGLMITEQNSDANNLKKLLECINEIRTELESIDRKVPGKEKPIKVTDTLISKILLGTLGCIPAVDRNFKMGIKRDYTNALVKPIGKDFIKALIKFYKDNIHDFQQ